jgi:hypothetical protein
MKTCNKCNITIDTKQPYCPLCHQILEGETNHNFKEVYPEYALLRRKVLPITKKIIFFLSFTSIIILAIINIAENSGTYWSLIPIGSILYFFTLVRVGVLSRRNIAFRIAFLTILLILLLIYIDYNSVMENNGWSINYLMPILLLSSNLAISAIIWIRRLNYRDYFFYLLIILIFSLIPLLLTFFDVVTVLWPSITSFTTAISILIIIIIFFPKSIKEEIKKRFHA